MTAIPDDQELLDLVDSNDQVVGHILHSEIYDKANLGSFYIRAVNALIMNDTGKLWIPRRTATKKYAANGLDYSVGEHVMSGESYDAAIVRGFEEELNLTTTIGQFEMFYGSQPLSFEGDTYFVHNYLLHSNVSPDYNRDDFSGAEWLTPNELLSRIASGETVKPGLPEVIEALLDYQAQSKSSQ